MKTRVVLDNAAILMNAKQLNTIVTVMLNVQILRVASAVHVKMASVEMAFSAQVVFINFWNQ